MSWRSSLALVANVLGVGCVFLPWTATAAFGPAALAGWGYHVLAGALLVTALARVDRRDGALPLISARLGRPAARAVSAGYVAGITAGQAVVALVAAAFLRQALGVPDIAIGPLAAGVLALSAGLAHGRWQVAATPMLCLLMVLLIVTPVLAPLTEARAPAALLPDAVGQAAALQCFVVVGWESAARLAPAGRRHPWLAPVLGVAAVGVLYGVALLAAPAVATDRTVLGLALPDLSGSTAGRVVALMLGLLAALYCLRNIRTAARLTGATGKITLVATALCSVAAAGVLAIRAGWLPATTVLAVPNAMACAVFLAVGLATRRALGVLAGIAYLPLSWFLGPVGLVPVAVVGGAILLTWMENNHALAVPRIVRPVRGNRDRSGRR